MDDELTLCEYIYEDGSKVTDILPEDMIANLRRKYADNCFDLAAEVGQQLLDAGLLCAVVTFRSGEFPDVNIITLWNEVEREHKSYLQHSVLLFGDCIMDLLHYDNLIRTETYFNSLWKNYPEIRVVQELSGIWYTEDGYECDITIERLSHNDWGGSNDRR